MFNTANTNFIFNGDCRTLLHYYPDQYFDCVVSDVPYKIKTGGARVSEERLQGIAKRKKYGLTGLEADQIQQSLF